ERECCAESRLVIDMESARPLQRRLAEIRLARGVISPAAVVEDIEAVGLLQCCRRLVAKWRNRTEDQPRIRRLDLCGIESQTLQETPGMIVDDCTHGFDQRMQRLLSLRAGDIETD